MPELRDLLQQAAPPPRRPFDPDVIRYRVAQRRRRRLLTVGLGAVVLLAGAAGTGIALTREESQSLVVIDQPDSRRQDAMPSRCRSPQSIAVSLGGGLEGRAYLIYADGARFGVCAENGRSDEIRVNGQAELLAAIRRGGGAADLLLHGGTTISEEFAEAAAWADDRVVPVLLEAGQQLTLRSGLEWQGDTLIAERAYGCVDGPNGADDIAHVTVQWTASGTGTWTRVIYRVRGSEAIVVETNGGPSPVSDRKPGIASTLVPGRCQTIVPAAPDVTPPPTTTQPENQSVDCLSTPPPFVPSYLPNGWSRELRPMDGGGGGLPIRHWESLAPPPQRPYINVIGANGHSGRMGYSLSSPESIVVLGQRGLIGRIENGYGVRFDLDPAQAGPCWGWGLNGYGIAQSELRRVAEGLVWKPVTG